MGSLVLGVVQRPSLFVRLRKPAAILLGVMLLPLLPVAGMALLDWPQRAPSIAAVPAFPSGTIDPLPRWPTAAATVPVAKRVLIETPPADPEPAITTAATKAVVAKPAAAAKPRLAAKPAMAPKAKPAAGAVAPATITTTPLAPPPPAPAAVVWVQTESAPATSTAVTVDSEPPAVPTADAATATGLPAAAAAVVNSTTGTSQADAAASDPATVRPAVSNDPPATPQVDVSTLIDHLSKAINSGSGSQSTARAGRRD